ncbi:Type II secretion system (T2SS), protein M [Anaerobranca californiensis DSM 14826]|uniref:Type II secretion system (T2SS), protein M n=1 Tax=Anaerobranca californiensis DSM 14826 TaxID=1120989 RepID=A0A1M6LB41_9FIRM|nr:type II secretion system protein GspM [Anaerobranca californiensis]SHJ68396.1 Type II secretion system (T2SS), protein M [Anaerobranca californiensis DSM 14826]
MFSKLSPRERKLITFLGIIILLYLAYITLFEGNLAKLQEREGYLDSLQRQEEKLQGEMFQYNLLKNQYGNYDIEELLIKYPEKLHIPEIILWLEELFADWELSRPNISLNKVYGDISYLGITLSFTGPYDNIFNLIEKIEGDERLVLIESLNLSGSQNSLAANISIKFIGQSFEELSQGEYDFSNRNLFGGR